VPRTHDQLLVTLANGQLLALDQDSGDVVWTFDTGAPLVASGNPAATGDQVTSPGEPGSGIREGIFPGTDGSLYVFRAGAEGPPRIEVRAAGLISCIHGWTHLAAQILGAPEASRSHEMPTQQLPLGKMSYNVAKRPTS